MTPLSETILKDWQVRKTKKQKTAFIDFLTGRLPGLTVEEGGFPKSRNLVLGDPARAKVLLTAHYDTCAQLPFPNFITPMNIAVYVLYNMAIVVPFLLLLGLVSGLLLWLTSLPLLSFWVAYLVMMAAMLYLFMGGRPNPHTANDNTSGVIMLCELAAAMPETLREQVAFVFFDNEENGLLGSGQFRKRHKKDRLKEKLIINFDCVSDGDEFLFVQNKPALRQYGEALAAAFPAEGEKLGHFVSSSKAFYPSDQAGFPVALAVASMRRNKWVGLYMNRIHTPKDTVFDRANIDYLRAGTLRFLAGLCGGGETEPEMAACAAE